MSDEQQPFLNPGPALSPPPPGIKIPKSISTGAEPFYVLVISDDSARRCPGGSPIVWEHPLPATTGLREVLKKQAEIGDRYGASYIAECRIIPELTRDPGSEQPERRGPG